MADSVLGLRHPQHRVSQRPLYLDPQKHRDACLPPPWAGAIGRHALAPCPQEEL